MTLPSNKQLIAFVEKVPSAAHFVLLKPPDLKKAGYKWNQTKPSKTEVLNHLRSNSDHRLGIVPSSLGWAAVDYDGGSPSELANFAKKLKPVAKLPTSGGKHHCHMLLHLTKTELTRHAPNRVLKNDSGEKIGDWRCKKGYVLLHKGCESELMSALEITGGKPRDSASEGHDFEFLFPRQRAKAAKASKTNAKKKGGNEVVIPNSLGRVDSVLWMLKQLGYHCKYSYHSRILFFNDSPITNELSAKLRFDCLDRFVQMTPAKKQGDPPVESPYKVGIGEWNSTIDAIKEITKFDPVLDWFRSCSHPDINSLSEAKEYAKKWFHEVFAVKGGKPTELSQFLSEHIITGLVARRRHPGVIIKTYPVIIGPSNTGKTALVGSLLPNDLRDYAQPRLNIDKKADDLVYDILGMSPVELSEMGNITGADGAHLKSWLSEGKWTGRLRFERNIVTVQFTHFMIGTANLETDPLPKDKTAAERFLVQEVVAKPHDPNVKEGLVEDYLEKNRVKMFAAANLIIDSWEAEGGIDEVSKRLRTLPIRLRGLHEQQAKAYRFKPYSESIAERVWDYLTANDKPAPHASEYKLRPVAPHIIEGKGYWTLNDFRALIPELANIQDRVATIILRDDVGLTKEKQISKGRLRGKRPYTIGSKLNGEIKARRIEAIQDWLMSSQNKRPLTHDGTILNHDELAKITHHVEASGSLPYLHKTSKAMN